jgi:hypothetical protein
MKRMYFILAFFGFVIPYYFLIRFLVQFGLDPVEMGNQLFANDMSTFFAVDLMIVAVVFLIFSYFNSRKLGMKRWWVYVIATLLIGPSFSIPLYLGIREDFLYRSGKAE